MRWVVDPDHSVVAFSIRHLMVANVHGQINKVAGTVHFNPEDLTGLSIELEIDISNIITGITKRDDHLKSQDFFHEEKHPKASFKSSGCERTGFNRCRVSGDLTIHGIGKHITMEVDVTGPVKSPFGETTIGISGRTVLNREDFGLTWNQPVEGNGLMVGKYAEIFVNIEADLPEK